MSVPKEKLLVTTEIRNQKLSTLVSFSKQNFYNMSDFKSAFYNASDFETKFYNVSVFELESLKSVRF